MSIWDALQQKKKPQPQNNKQPLKQQQSDYTVGHIHCTDNDKCPLCLPGIEKVSAQVSELPPDTGKITEFY